MTRIFTPAQQKRFERVQNEHMPDGCYIHRWTADIQDESGQPIPQYEVGPLQPCGFELKFSAERFVDSGEGQKFYNKLRVPNGTLIGKRDLVQMAHRGGSQVPEQTIFEVSGEPQYGITATVIGLKEHNP